MYASNHANENFQYLLSSMHSATLLRYSKMDLPHLALILDTTANELRDVYYGRGFLVGKQAEELTLLFLVYFGE